MAKPDELKTINLSTRELTTQMQLNSLLSVASFTWSAMQGPPPNPFTEEPAKHNPIRGEAPVAAETLFVKTCEAMEKIVSDPERFDFSFQKKIEDDYARAMELNVQYIQAQRDAAVEAASPHSVCNPTLVRLADGQFMAVLGNPNSAKDSLVGTGVSPQAALEAFDEAFRGAASQIKNEQKQQQQKVDRGTDTTTPEPPKRRRIYPRNKPADGQDAKGSGESAV
jgi:hypothetical protein